jgi:hypothetical protein
LKPAVLPSCATPTNAGIASVTNGQGVDRYLKVTSQSFRSIPCKLRVDWP